MLRRRNRRWSFLTLAVGGAVALLASGAPGGAEDPLARALAQQQQRAAETPGDARVWNDLGDLLALAGDAAAAETAYRQALAVDAASGTAHYNLGRLLLDGGQRRQARRHLARAIELEPSLGAAHYYLGAAYEASGRGSKARRAYRRAFELAPHLADPARNPHVAGSRQALAAQLLAWATEGAANGPARQYEQTRAIVTQAGLGEPHTDAAAPVSQASAGGVVRSVRGAPAVDSAAVTSAEPEPDLAVGSDPGRPRPARGTTGANGIVLGAGDLRSARVVNQAGAAGVESGDDGRVGSRTGRTSPGRSPRTAPFNPPPRPSPFIPGPDSTGRLESVIEPLPVTAPAIS